MRDIHLLCIHTQLLTHTQPHNIFAYNDYNCLRLSQFLCLSHYSIVLAVVVFVARGKEQDITGAQVALVPDKQTINVYQ